MPAASEPRRPSPAVPATPSLPLRFRPLGVRVVGTVCGVLLLVTLVGVWFALPDDVQHEFTVPQWVTCVAMVLGALAIGHALARCRVDADESGLTLVNGYRTHRMAWSQVVAVHLRPGNPWATLDLTDGTARSAMGIQGSDGQRAIRQTRQLRALVEAHAAVDPHDPPPRQPGPAAGPPAEPPPS
jgi:hypothetical protein